MLVLFTCVVVGFILGLTYRQERLIYQYHKSYIYYQKLYLYYYLAF